MYSGYPSYGGGYMGGMGMGMGGMGMSPYSTMGGFGMPTGGGPRGLISNMEQAVQTFGRVSNLLQMSFGAMQISFQSIFSLIQGSLMLQTELSNNRTQLEEVRILNPLMIKIRRWVFSNILKIADPMTKEQLENIKLSPLWWLVALGVIHSGIWFARLLWRLLLRRAVEGNINNRLSAFWEEEHLLFSRGWFVGMALGWVVLKALAQSELPTVAMVKQMQQWQDQMRKQQADQQAAGQAGMQMGGLGGMNAMGMGSMNPGMTGGTIPVVTTQQRRRTSTSSMSGPPRSAESATVSKLTENMNAADKAQFNNRVANMKMPEGYLDKLMGS